MKINFKLSSILFSIVFCGLFFCFSNFVFASTVDGTVSGYAWSDQIGWINFGAFSGTNAIHITDSGLTGYAWNENKGRINLNPTKSGVKNYGDGTLSGYAWCEGTGWIYFSGVSVSSSGIFSGTATGDNNVTIHFSCKNCNVQTDWRPASARGGGGGPPSGAYSAPVSPFSILINDGNKYTNNLNVTLKLLAGSDVKKMAISNSPGFENAVQEDYQITKTWILTQGDGQKNVYVKFYTQYGQPSQVIQSDIILDTVAPEIKVVSVKDKYNPGEEVVLSGTTTENNVDVDLLINGQYGYFQSDDKGNWFVTFGKLPEGNYQLKLIPKDAALNVGDFVTVNFVVTKEAALPSSPSSIINQIQNGINFLIPKFLQPRESKPVAVVTVPETAPVALQSVWNLLPAKALSTFVLAPLPKDIAVIAQKFPQVQNTFNQVGISKITDVTKLQSANLKLPGLTQAIGLNTPQIGVENFAMPPGIPIAKLTATAKTKIPSEIVFAKAAGGLVDYNIALSLNDQGNTEQTINTISGQPLQLVVRVDSPAKKVVGYIVFKSKTQNPTAFNVPLNYMAASLSFAGPDLSKIFNPAQIMLASVNGAPTLQANTVIKNTDSGTGAATQPSQIQKKLVLAEFEYQDTGNGVYTADVTAPVPAGEYEVMTVIDYQDPNLLPKEIDLITVVDPEGYVYEKNGDMETRIVGAVVSLYWLNPATKQYELWPAKDYQQVDPQVTDVSGTYSFLVPNGDYYLTVDAPGYLSYDGKPFQVTEGSGVHINIELKTKYWWLNVIDWKTALLIIAILLLLYNFYKDRIREKINAAKN